jgi:hypothetical protein
MPPVELAALILVLVMLVIGWTYFLVHRRSLPRLWVLVARKPHATRRAYQARQLILGLETMWMVVVALTAMLVAVLLATYLVKVEHWPDGVGVALFLATGVLALAWVVIGEIRLTRRLGLECPSCGAALARLAVIFLRTGQCPYCSAVVFRTHRLRNGTMVNVRRGAAHGPDRNPLGRVIIALALLVAFVGVGRLVAQVHALRKYQPVRAVLTEITVKAEGGRRGRTFYTPIVRYEYQVGGKKYEGSRSRWGSRAFGDPLEARRAVASHKPGQRVTVYVDPAAASRSFFRRGLPSRALIWAPLGMFGLLALACWFLVPRHRRT